MHGASKVVIIGVVIGAAVVVVGFGLLLNYRGSGDRLLNSRIASPFVVRRPGRTMDDYRRLLGTAYVLVGALVVIVCSVILGVH